MSTNDLVQRASMGTITSKELESVAEFLRNRAGDDYDHLLVLGRAGATQYRDIVEEFLQNEDDAMLARLALQVLCRYWGLTEEYKSQVQQFVSGTDWDEDDDVRIMAISCTDSLIANPQNSDLLAEIYRIATDQNEDDVARQAAYSAIAISSGIKPSDLPSPARFDFENDMDSKLLEDVKSRILD